MSKPVKTKQTLARVAVIASVVAGLSGFGAALISAQAQEKPVELKTAETPDEPITYAALKAETVQGTDAAAAAPAQTVARPTTATTAARKPFFGDKVDGKPILLRKPMPPAKVDWQAAVNRSGTMAKQARISGGLKARLPKAQLDKTRLPVVLPREGGVVDTAKAKMMSFGDAYALNMPQPNRKGTQVTVYGNRTFVPTDSGAISKRPIARLAGVVEDIRIGQMEDGWTATFTRYGVVYSIDVSCDSMNSDDCKTDSYIRDVIAQMDDVTMGSEAQSEADQQIKDDGNWLNQVSKTISKITKGG